MLKRILLSFLFISSFTNIFAQSWTSQNVGFQSSSNGVERISIVDANTAWCVSGLNTQVHEFARTTDGGVTWNNGRVIPDSGTMYFSGIAAIDSSIAFVCMFSSPKSGGKIYKTIDGGSTWNESGAGTVFTDIHSFPDEIYFWDAANGFVIGDPINGVNEIYTTSDSGNTWVLVPNGNLPMNLYGTLASFSPLVVMDSTIWFATTKGQVLKSTDRGNNWTITTIDSSSTLYSIGFLEDKLNGIALYGSGSCYRTSDGGDSWTPFIPAGAGPHDNIKLIPGTNYFVSASSASIVKSSYSVDTGNTWIAIDYNRPHYGLAFKDINTGYAGGLQSSGGIYKWDAGILGIKQSTLENQFIIYPNPVIDLLTIKSNLILSGKNKLELLNVFGQVLYSSLINTSEIQLDLKIVSAGIYFLNVISNRKKETFKIQKL